jgi:hypothetical protein
VPAEYPPKQHLTRDLRISIERGEAGGCALLPIVPEILTAPYGSFMQELIDPESATSKFVPQFAVVVLTPCDIPEWPPSFATAQDADAVAERVAKQLLASCEQLRNRCGTEVLIDNFHALPTRPLGNVGARVEHAIHP